MRPSLRVGRLRLTRLPLALEIALALLLKIVILLVLWKMFFSSPQTKKMALPTPQVEQHLLATAPAAKAQAHSSPPPKAPDDPAR